MYLIILTFSTNTTYPGRQEGPAYVDGVKRHLSDHHILYHVSNVIIINTLSHQPLQVCMKYLALCGVHPHHQSGYLQLALSDIMSLLLNNSFWAKTLTYSVDLLHGHGLLLHTNHLLPLQYGPALSLRVHGDSAHSQF